MEQHPYEPPRSEEGIHSTTPDRVGCIGAEPSRGGHLPDLVDPLVPLHPETSFTQTRRLRHDGWTAEKKRLFLQRYAECGVIVEASEAAGMSARAAYNLRDRDPLFAAGWDAAVVKARAPLADEAYTRSRNGVVERIYKDGQIVAERHRYDNRLTMAVLARLDARIDQAEAKGAPHLALVARWDDFLQALGEDRRDDGMALLAPPAPEPQPALPKSAGDRELHELHPVAKSAATNAANDDPHEVWHETGIWLTNYPPPADFDGDEEGEYGDEDYCRTLTFAEEDVMDAGHPVWRAEDRARAEAQRDAFFAHAEKEEEEEGDDEFDDDDLDDEFDDDLR